MSDPGGVTYQFTKEQLDLLCALASSPVWNWKPVDTNKVFTRTFTPGPTEHAEQHLPRLAKAKELIALLLNIITKIETHPYKKEVLYPVYSITKGQLEGLFTYLLVTPMYYFDRWEYNVGRTTIADSKVFETRISYDPQSHTDLANFLEAKELLTTLANAADEIMSLLTTNK